MADEFYYDDRVPLLWALQQLEADADWLALYGHRTYEVPRIPHPPVYPYAFINPEDSDVMSTSGSLRRILKVTTDVNVIVVKRFPLGDATRFIWQPTRRILLRALCPRFVDQDILLNGEKIGEVHGSDFLRTVDYIEREGDEEIYHYGIAVHLTHI
jgi:hypothetical protein